MKCFSRSTLGVGIGILNIVVYIGLVIFSIAFLENMAAIKVETSEEEADIATSRIIFVCVIVFCLIMIIISGLLITGIVKKYHKLMLPWLVIAGIGYFYKCGHFIFILFQFASSGASVSFIFSYLFTGLLGFAISALILLTIFKLYQDVRDDNMKKPDRVTMAAENGYQKHNNI